MRTLGLCLTALVLVGCTDQTAPPASSSSTPAVEATPASEQGVIGVSLLTLENPFFKVIGDTITAEGKQHGYEAIVLSADKDVAKQGNQVKDFIVRKVSAIVLSPCDSRSIVPVIQEANAAGIPVFTVDIPCREKGVKIVTQVATDNFSGGREAGKAIAEAFGPAGGEVAIVHFKQAESCQLRVAGFREFIEEHNAKAENKVEIVTELEGGGAKDIGAKAAEDALQAHPNLRGMFCINDPSALGAVSAVEKAGKSGQVIIVGFDGQPDGKQAIKEGKIYADPIQFPDRMGLQIVDSIVQHAQGDEVPPEILIPTSLYRKADAEKDPELK
jgi:ribose transport system substrate-binding protein